MLIGHDPRLQKSDTVASFCLFADYYFRPKPTSRSEAAKYGLAASVFDMVLSLTGGMIAPEQVLVTNLCNRALTHAPNGKTVFIPRHEAEQGVSELRQLLSGSAVQVVLAMSLQVNYWLQELGFCTANPEFVTVATPQATGRTGKDWSKLIEPRDADLNKLAGMLKDLQARKRQVFGFVNNHFEGCAPLTIERIRERMA